MQAFKKQVEVKKTQRPVGNIQYGKNEFQSLRKKSTSQQNTTLHQQETVTFENSSNPFDLETLQQTWNNIILSLTKGEGKRYGILSSVALSLDEKTYLITIHTLHKSHISELNKIKDSLRNSLIMELKNSSIQLVFKHSTNTKKEKVGFYTSRDKVNFFLKKNPALQKLIDALNLQLDFD